MSSLIYERLKNALSQDVPAAVGTVVRGPNVGGKVLILPDEVLGSLGAPDLDARVVADARALLQAERSEIRSYELAAAVVEVFIETFPPPPVLLIFGAVHVAQPLARFGKMLGFRVIVSDARAKLATPERFPDVDRLIVAWPDEALAELTIGPNTYIAILTHDPKFDEPALLGA
ncbi:MAG: xanthine dehydrogenase, partial [Chloroflexota bacterium]